MIAEQYVSFDTAKLLKEAGFDIPTRGIYRTNRTGEYSFAEYVSKQTTDDLSWNFKAGALWMAEYLCHIPIDEIIVNLHSYCKTELREP